MPNIFLAVDNLQVHIKSHTRDKNVEHWTDDAEIYHRTYGTIIEAMHVRASFIFAVTIVISRIHDIT